jgi:ribose 5-phosphate isomerase B
MTIAVGSDMRNNTTDFVIQYLQSLGHSLQFFGALPDQTPAPWPKVAIEAARAVASGKAEQAVLFCWTGTGISIAANKVKGVRAALCTDAATAEGARKWNDANALAMSLRLTSEEVAREIIDAWFAPVTGQDEEDLNAINQLKEYENGGKIA